MLSRKYKIFIILKNVSRVFTDICRKYTPSFHNHTHSLFRQMPALPFNDKIQNDRIYSAKIFVAVNFMVQMFTWLATVRLYHLTNGVCERAELVKLIFQSTTFFFFHVWIIMYSSTEGVLIHHCVYYGSCRCLSVCEFFFSFYLKVCLLFVCVCVYLSVQLSVCMSVYMYVRLAVCLFVCLS